MIRRLVKAATSSAVLLVVLAAAGGEDRFIAGLSESSPPDLPGWRLTFHDEFSGRAGNRPDPAKWLPDAGGRGWGNNELQYYTSNRNVFQDGAGSLVIEARQGGGGRACWYGECRYTSGKLTTRSWAREQTFAQRYGRFEARLKLPVGKGLWPAFWLLGSDISDVGYPEAGEIDIVETLGDRPYQSSFHVHGPGLATGTASTFPDGGRISDWHTYRVDWGPDHLTWSVDDRPRYRVTKRDMSEQSWVFDHDFYIILNLAVGGDWPGSPDDATKFPARMLVDYVRVWESVG